MILGLSNLLENDIYIYKYFKHYLNFLLRMNAELKGKLIF